MSTGLALFTLFHVALSLAGIIAGLVVVFGLISAKQSKTWTSTFLVTTATTSLTGFLFPFHKFLPAHAVGVVSLLVFGGDDSGSLRLRSCGCIPARLCHRRSDRALAQRFRVDRAVFHEDSRAQGAGAHTVRTAISRNANCRDVDFRRADGARVQAISWGTRSCILSSF